MDNGITWETANAFDGEDAITVPEKSEVVATWLLNLTASQPVIFRITMFGGGNAATYLDDFSLYYTDAEVNAYDVNRDGEVNLGDVNSVINAILSPAEQHLSADVNGDGEVNIGDINAIIQTILQ